MCSGAETIDRLKIGRDAGIRQPVPSGDAIRHSHQSPFCKVPCGNPKSSACSAINTGIPSTIG